MAFLVERLPFFAASSSRPFPFLRSIQNSSSGQTRLGRLPGLIRRGRVGNGDLAESYLASITSPSATSDATPRRRGIIVLGPLDPRLELLDAHFATPSLTTGPGDSLLLGPFSHLRRSGAAGRRFIKRASKISIKIRFQFHTSSSTFDRSPVSLEQLGKYFDDASSRCVARSQSSGRRLIYTGNFARRARTRTLELSSCLCWILIFQATRTDGRDEKKVPTIAFEPLPATTRRTNSQFAGRIGFGGSNACRCVYQKREEKRK